MTATNRLAKPPSRLVPDGIAKGLRAEGDVGEIERLCADLVATWYIEPTTTHQPASAARTAPREGRKERKKPAAGILVQDEAPRGWMTGERGYKRA